MKISELSPYLTPGLVAEILEALFALAYTAQELGLEDQLNEYKGPAGLGAWDNAYQILSSIRELEDQRGNR